MTGPLGGEGPAPLPLEPVHPAASFSALLEARGLLPRWEAGPDAGTLEVVEATTVLALRYVDGVVMAGDRRATSGNVIAHKRVKKVYPADEYSAVAISGTAGMAVELIRLFQTELEHYEKIEDARLSLDGEVEALVAAAEEDAATGGVDLKRGIYPTVVTVTADGYREIPDEEVAEIAARVLEERP